MAGPIQRSLTILDALGDPLLLGASPAFRDLATWHRWLVFFSAVYGLPLSRLRDFGLSATDAEGMFRDHTGRRIYDPPPGGWKEIVAIVGRQSGKTRSAATIACFEAMTAAPEPDRTELFCLLVAQDQRAALRALFRYAKAIFDGVPILAASVASRRAEAIALNTGCVVAAYPCRPPALRGLRARVVVCDELAFYRSSEGFPTDAEMLRAARPLLATTGGRLIVLSSPYGQSGALYDLHRKHFGRDDSNVLVWQASASQMNPTLPADYLARMEADDPDAYRSEVLGEFRGGVSTLLDPESLLDSVAKGVRERSPVSRARYVSFVDAASGSGKDCFAVAIAHREEDRAVLDVCRAWKPPFNPSGVIAEAADLLMSYGLRETVGDRYAPGFVAEGFRSQNVRYRASDRDTSAIYLELVPLVNASRLTLLDQPELLRELRGLERRRGSSGRDRVDHRPGGHDDRAVAATGALVLALGSTSMTSEQIRRCLDAGYGRRVRVP